MSAVLGRRAVLAAAVVAACAPPRPPTEPVPGSPDGAETLATELGKVTFDRFDPQDGPRSARIVLVVFADFQCHFCAEAAETVAAERRARPSATRLVFKHYPLTMHPRARGIAALAQAVFLAKGAAAFWAFHDRLFAKLTATDEEIRGWAAELGVAGEGLEAVADKAAEQVGADLALARLLGLTGAPGIVVNHRVIQGSPAPDLLKAALDGALRKPPTSQTFLGHAVFCQEAKRGRGCFPRWRDRRLAGPVRASRAPVSSVRLSATCALAVFCSPFLIASGCSKSSSGGAAQFTDPGETGGSGNGGSGVVIPDGGGQGAKGGATGQGGASASTGGKAGSTSAGGGAGKGGTGTAGSGVAGNGAGAMGPGGPGGPGAGGGAAAGGGTGTGGLGGAGGFGGISNTGGTGMGMGGATSWTCTKDQAYGATSITFTDPTTPAFLAALNALPASVHPISLVLHQSGGAQQGAVSATIAGSNGDVFPSNEAPTFAPVIPAFGSGMGTADAQPTAHLHLKDQQGPVDIEIDHLVWNAQDSSGCGQMTVDVYAVIPASQYGIVLHLANGNHTIQELVAADLPPDGGAAGSGPTIDAGIPDFDGGGGGFKVPIHFSFQGAPIAFDFGSL